MKKECPITKPWPFLANLISGSRPWFPDVDDVWMCCCVRRDISDKRLGIRVNDGECEAAIAVRREHGNTHESMNTLNFFCMKTRPGLRDLGFEMPVQVGVGEEQLPTRQHEVLPVPHGVQKVRPSAEMTRLHKITKCTKCMKKD